MRSRAIVIAYHAIFTMYGFWLLNDPRGSYSDFVAAWNLWWEGDVYLDADEDVRRAIAYVRENPLKERRPAQRWDFEAAYPSAGGVSRPDERAG